MAAGTMTLTVGTEGARARGRSEAGMSIVVPVFNEAGNLPALHGRIAEVANHLRSTRRLTCEVIYVDDGSSDATLSVAHGLAADVLDVMTELAAKSLLTTQVSGAKVLFTLPHTSRAYALEKLDSSLESSMIRLRYVQLCGQWQRRQFGTHEF